MCIISAYCLIPLTLAQDAQGDKVILEVIINGHNEGLQFMLLTHDGDVLLTPKVLETLRLRGALWAGQVGTNISLRSLVPKIQFSVDQNNSTLSMAVPTQWFEKQVIRNNPPPTPTVHTEALVHPLNKAAFLNYSVQTSLNDTQGATNITLPLELGFNYGQWLAVSTFNTNYDRTQDKIETIRQMTSLLWDDTENMRSLHIGDF